jgi:hypothetical protein
VRFFFISVEGGKKNRIELEPRIHNSNGEKPLEGIDRPRMPEGKVNR